MRGLVAVLAGVALVFGNTPHLFCTLVPDAAAATPAADVRAACPGCGGGGSLPQGDQSSVPVPHDPEAPCERGCCNQEIGTSLRPITAPSPFADQSTFLIPLGPPSIEGSAPAVPANLHGGRDRPNWPLAERPPTESLGRLIC